MVEKIKVAVIFGGRSGEHEVSLLSAQSVMAALDPEKYDIIPVGITRSGEWMVGADPMAALSAEDYTALQPAAILADPSKKGLWTADRLDADTENSRQDITQQDTSHAMDNLTTLSRVDVVFPVLHGTYGEDGTVQGLLELADVPYVGAGVLCSAVAMDKIIFKDVVKSHGLPVAPHIWTTRKHWRAEADAVMDEVEEKLGYPVFTKPANLGSSVGIMKCRNRAELLTGLIEALRYDRRVLVEWAVPSAREIEVSVLGNEEPMASVPGEIVPKREFYDYIAKYLADGEEVSDLIIPAPLETEVTERIKALAVAAYKAIDGAG
ncbi:MAG: D-alanine--D-alanine ligase, partial [Anaerolineae bacterium]|nr:D-alanine--D-alanine ligase [Anaerolineae bacterium]